jgi:plastocyanin
VIEGFAYQVPLEVPAGVTVTVRNDDQATHTVTADDGSFAVEVVGGATGSFEGPSAGSYPFHCEIHASMTGELQVA